MMLLLLCTLSVVPAVCGLTRLSLPVLSIACALCAGGPWHCWLRLPAPADGTVATLQRAGARERTELQQ
jgi:hypothetical protein